MSQMRYSVQIQAYQIMDGAQVLAYVKEIPDQADEPPVTVRRLSFTAVELDITSPEGWARDVLVELIEHL